MNASGAPASKVSDSGRQPLAEISGLSVDYVTNGSAQTAVAELDLRLDDGEVVAIVGESGSGKSTTAAAIIGLLAANGRITAGAVQVAGIDTVTASERQLLKLRGLQVGFIPQDPMVSLNPTKRVGAQIAEVVKRRGVTGPQITAQVQEFLTQAGVPEPATRARQYPHELSGGLRQRVLIAIALAGQPRLIIADEPTSALDVTVQKRIIDHLGALVRDRGISLLIITHDLAVAADAADRVVVMQHGRKVEEGAPHTILRNPAQPYTRALIAAAPGLAHADLTPAFDVRNEPAPEPILTLKEVNKTFPASHTRKGQRGFNALESVNVTVPRGQTHALVGESGCGKTTTLRIALGLEAATSGSVVFDGTEISGLSWRAARPLRRRVQLVHQDPYASLDPRFTVEQSIAEPLVSFGVGDRRSRRARVRELLDQVALPAHFVHRLPRELSGGQRQRVAIARALSLRPELLMLDEPVSALDVLVQDQILSLLSDLQTELGLTYLFVSHDLSVVSAVAHTVSVMSRGRVVEEGPVAQVFTAPAHEYTCELIDAIPGRRFRAA